MPFAIRLSRSSSSRSSIVSIDRQGFLIPTPTLAQVVSDSAPDPWTLAAFKAFLSEKFCLETLEFVLDVAAYRKSFDSISACNQTSPLDKDDVESTSLLWQHILRTYIEPQAPREINIPFNIRGYLLGLLDSDSVPPPDAFLPATNMMLELMGGLLFLEFLQHLQHLDAVSTPSPDERSERCALKSLRSKSFPFL
ncbi:MAG: hypothetical protein M1827_006131 [Pycnora praestabilis]|nr:MAG: hypothetical protein M1827_006131 [Pycnora praestabilis]